MRRGVSQVPFTSLSLQNQIGFLFNHRIIRNSTLPHQSILKKSPLFGVGLSGKQHAVVVIEEDENQICHTGPQ
jgi:hypothetical protein